MFSEGDAAISLDLASGVNLDLSTWATRFCSSSIGVLVPRVSARLLQRDGEFHDWTAAGELTTGATIDVYTAGKGWRSAVAEQQAFIREQDADTKRIAYLYDPSKLAPPEGQFFYDVHVPTPRPPSDEEKSCDSSGEESESDGDIRIPASSASSSSDDEERSRTRPLPGKKLASSRARRVRGASSLSEEGSASASSHSSVPSCDLPDTSRTADPNHLATKIRLLRSMKRPLMDFTITPEPSRGTISNSIEVAGHRGGKVVNISVLPVVATMDPSAALPIAELMSSAAKTGYGGSVSLISSRSPLMLGCST